MAGQLIVLCIGDDRNAAKHLTRLQRVPTHLRSIIRDMAAGIPVNAEDASNALFQAAIASVSAKGTSVARREDAAACQQVWDVVRREMGVAAAELQGLSGSLVDLNDPREVEAWLAS